ncbi:Vms1/Ankzf1 family peptidyl-tRNA hydrolase [Methanococcoides sp. NM1]|uniref:Vms1/Ankzf1 family peptidyl-tRNA hydrolase n=1 Tax=Methanococcoides sp. NM1 TaxID=1201013 RepID=UPI0010827282|nr:Vms1/Ankzf1 family peptidyl-tRNA hydrolase [Methanococcoides sp. NM1]
MAGKKKVTGNLNTLFNKYSGKEKLEDEIDKLQSHILELEIDRKRFEKNETNAKRALAAKQEAEEKLKAANVKIETLTYQLEEKRTEVSEEISFALIEEVTPSQMTSYIDQLASIRSDRDSLLTAYITENEMNLNVGILKDGMREIDQNSQYLIQKIKSDTGYALFYDRMQMVKEVVVPALPFERSSVEMSSSFGTGTLKSTLMKDINVCILAAHAGESLIGISSDKTEFEEDMIIRSSVKAKHTKGGFSQRRFERLRDEDIDHHVEKVRSALKNMLEHATVDIDMIIICGDNVLANYILENIDTDIPIMERNIDAKIEKHDIDSIIRSIFSCRRYKL